MTLQHARLRMVGIGSSRMEGWMDLGWKEPSLEIRCHEATSSHSITSTFCKLATPPLSWVAIKSHSLKSLTLDKK